MGLLCRRWNLGFYTVESSGGARWIIDVDIDRQSVFKLKNFFWRVSVVFTFYKFRGF